MKKNNGQSLIEVFAALGIVTLVILGIVKATTVSVKNANYSQDQTQAVSLAQKKISEIIDGKNNNPVTFFNPLPTPSEDQDGQFCLKTTLTPILDIPATAPAGAEMAKITVVVYWGEKGNENPQCDGVEYLHNYQVQTDVTN